MSERLAAEVARFARSLPVDQVELAAAYLERQAAPVPGMREAVAALVPTAPFRAQARVLVDTWAMADGLSGAALALSLRAAVRVSEAGRSEQHIEVVWTGPEGRLDTRMTYAVVVEVIGAARKRLTLVSFAAYRVEAVVEALREAALGGVEVRLVLDGGTPAARAFRTLGDAVHVYTWEPTLRDANDPGHAAMHAKAALADDQVALVTSANLTGHALDRNMELGLLVRGGDVPRALAEHFDGLIKDGVLVPAAVRS
ncbi:MAG: DISARM system phospholipase D-like protein DrmC [Actinomycetota bacterium]|nr:DISARM system phospholipase D-like protein DrmC [Actinomycetota bacterium]